MRSTTTNRTTNSPLSSWRVTCCRSRASRRGSPPGTIDCCKPPRRAVHRRKSTAQSTRPTACETSPAFGWVRRLAVRSVTTTSMTHFRRATFTAWLPSSRTSRRRRWGGRTRILRSRPSRRTVRWIHCACRFGTASLSSSMPRTGTHGRFARPTDWISMATSPMR